MRQKKVKEIRRFVNSMQLQPSESKKLERKIRQQYNQSSPVQKISLMKEVRGLTKDGAALVIKELINAQAI